MRLSKRQLLGGLGSLAIAAAMPATALAAPRRVAGRALGTAWRVAWAGGAGEADVARAMRAVLHSVDAAMSPFQGMSEISRFNTTVTRDWQPVSRAICSVVREGLEIAALSGGAFDPTVGPIVGRYGFGPIVASDSRGSFHSIVVGEERVRKLQPGLTVDLCGIAKGHCVDCMATALARIGLSDYLIDFGGEVIAHGMHPNGRIWQVGIEAPMPGERSFQRVVRLHRASIATSGDATNSYVVNGRRFSHIIDPHRREPADNNIASVSVLMPTTSAADGLATALMAMGHEKGPELAGRAGISALFLVRDGSGLREIMTGRFADAVIA